MKFSVSSYDLLQHLNKSAGAIGSNPVLPILEDFLFVIRDQVLTITATNLETSIISTMEVRSEGDGEIAIPARILLDTLKALPDQPIAFTIDEKTNGIQIKSEYGQYKLAGDNAEDYPDIPQVEVTESVDFDVSVMANALTKTLFATSNDELRLAMTGVLFQVDFNKVTIVATDAHKLVKFTYNGISTDQTGSFIIPKKSLTLLKSAIPNEGTLSLRHNKSNAFFSVDGLELICRLIDAKYPDYNAVIPVDNPNLLTVPRTDFLNSLKRIAIYANKTTNQVALSLDEGSLTISAQDLDFSNEATEQLSCQYSGEPMQIGFNARFLIEMLSVLETEEIKFELSTPNRAGIMLPGEEKENEDLLMLVMPVMMNA